MKILVIEDEKLLADATKALLESKGLSVHDVQTFDAETYKQQQYDLLADAVREALDMDTIYRILNREV